MIIRRPLQHRQIAGAMFGEDAVLIKRTQRRNKFGEDSFTEQRVSIRVSTNPPRGDDPRLASLQQGGIRLEDTREFFTAEDISTTPQDHIEYNDEVYVAQSTSRFGSYSSSLFQRKEDQ